MKIALLVMYRQCYRHFNDDDKIVEKFSCYISHLITRKQLVTKNFED